MEHLLESAIRLIAALIPLVLYFLKKNQKAGSTSKKNLKAARNGI
jgi:hypothetical protein